MTFLSRKYQRLFVKLVLAVTVLVSAGQVSANGPVGEHVNHLQDNLGSYAEEVDWLIRQVDEMVDAYEADGVDAVKTGELVDYWEAVDFHAAIETNYVPVYASIWQGLFGVKGSIDKQQPIAEVRKQQRMLEQALWQALGAVKLAARYQQKGLLAKVETSKNNPATPGETIDTIKHRLDRVVAKYAEKLNDEATGIIHDTYLDLFEGLEGALIEQDAGLVEGLEKDFNVTLPKAIQNKSDVEKVRQVVQTMQDKLDKAKKLLLKADKERKDVF